MQLSAFTAAFANVRYAKLAARRLEALGLITIELTPHPEAENLNVRCPGNRNVGVLVASLTPGGRALLDLGRS